MFKFNKICGILIFFTYICGVLIHITTYIKHQSNLYFLSADNKVLKDYDSCSRLIILLLLIINLSSNMCFVLNIAIKPFSGNKFEQSSLHLLLIFKYEGKNKQKITNNFIPVEIYHGYNGRKWNFWNKEIMFSLYLLIF